VTTLALATVWPGLIEGIADRGRCSVTHLDLHGIDLGPIESTALSSAFHTLTSLDISFCQIPVNHLQSLLLWGFYDTSSCLLELNLEGVENLKNVPINCLPRLEKLDKLNLSNTGLSISHYKEYFEKITSVDHGTNSAKKFPSELSLCSEQSISSLPPYLHALFVNVRVLNISNLTLKPDLLMRIFKRLGDDKDWAELEELVICDTPLDSLDQETLADGVLMLRKANIARCSLNFVTVSHLLKEVAARVQGKKRLRELDVSRNTGGVDLDLVIRARRQLDVLKIHSGCQSMVN